MDPEFLTLGDESKMFEKVARDEVGAFTAYASNIPTLEAALEANGVEGAELIPVIPSRRTLRKAGGNHWRYVCKRLRSYKLL